jgi:membrane protein insertase Oxa1/YidC/SpoIIIJ
MLALLAQAANDFNYDYSVDLGNGNTAATTGLVAGLGIFFLVFMLIGLVLFIFNIWMIIDCAARQDSDFPNNNKSMWLILMIVGIFIGFGWIVALVYYFSIKKKAGKKVAPATPKEPPTEQPKQ